MPLENRQLNLFETDGEARASLQSASPARLRPDDALPPGSFLPDPSSRPAADASQAPAPAHDTATHRAAPPDVPTLKPPSLPPGVRWRQVQTADQPIGFMLRRSRRKSIGLAINDDGLLVTAPNWVTLGQIDEAVQAKSRWILEKLRLLHERQQQLAMADTQWKDGTQIPYFGQRIELSLGHAGQAHAFTGRPLEPQEGDRLLLTLPRDADHQRVRDSVHTWLQARATEWFEQRLNHFLTANNLSINRWRLSSASTRWGSCSSDGNIMLNWRLIHFDREIIDYVVVHEIAHLRQMNHSQNFWKEVGRMLPGFESARNALRQHDPASLPLI